MNKLFLKKIFIIIFFIFFSSNSARADLFLGLNGGWHNYAFKDQNSQPTTNYYGIGWGIKTGYQIPYVPFSLISVWADYIPGSLKKAKLLTKESWVLKGGLGLEFFIESLSLGIKGGKYIYNCNLEDDTYSVNGKWEGWGANIFISITFLQDETYFWQINLSTDQASMSQTQSYTEQTPTNNVTKQNLNIFSISLSYNYTLLSTSKYSNPSSRESKSIIGSFLKSLLF